MVYFDKQQELLNGIEKLYKAVKSTLGAKGRTVLINYDKAFLTKDGVTVANYVKLKGLEDCGAKIIREVANQVNKEAGDGTTTATILAYHLYKNGIKMINAGADPMSLKRGLDKGLKEVLIELEKQKITPTENDIKSVAIISANNDVEMGTLIYNAIKESGENGIINVQESKGLTDEIEKSKGFQINKGFASNYFINKKTYTEFDNSKVLLYNDRINSIQEIMPVLEFVQKDNSPLLILCKDMDSECLNTLVVNNIKGNLRICVVKNDYLEFNDIQALCGGKIQNPTNNVYFTNIKDDLGIIEKVIINKDNSTFISNNDISEYIAELKEKLKLENDKILKENLKQRIAKLSDGIVTIKVQASSELETKEKRDRVDDALNSAKSAKDGVLLGGGNTLMNLKVKNNLKGDEKIGFDILLNTLKEPFNQICLNAGVSPEVVKRYKGFNILTLKKCDLYKAGILDSYKVQKTALINAVSVVSNLLTTDCILSPEDI